MEKPAPEGIVWPRRAFRTLMVPAEVAICAAVDAVEEAGADVLLTEAVNLLGQAREKVADYIDQRINKDIKTRLEEEARKHSPHVHSPSCGHFPQSIDI